MAIAQVVNVLCLFLETCPSQSVKCLPNFSYLIDIDCNSGYGGDSEDLDSYGGGNESDQTELDSYGAAEKIREAQAAAAPAAAQPDTEAAGTQTTSENRVMIRFTCCPNFLAQTANKQGVHLILCFLKDFKIYSSL